MNDRAPPIPTQWDGEAFVPVSQRFAKLADKFFVVGEVYALVVEQPRSGASHNHQFAWLHDAWMNLPEDIAPLYPTEVHLRKRALIAAGYFTEVAIDAGSRAAAARIVAAVPALDEFAFAKIEGSTVLIRRAKSQSMRAMGAKQFYESKAAIMHVIADMLGVTPADLQKNAGGVAA
ncbi:hypothetical protein EZH22_24620 [Xanthobacter dioxanivorans]|uniref:Uncharacterized protein n=1 Tax=Xanthobacter dioxanivorans TaxID=2528964 RepID=A0A974PMV7_9HYPH|nr:hypothetical protein [Xanthobacter dioxanivorans]QRG06136.1 hypothetical protein EZH22_24620 [Xanthobacter dioxanivorans]